MSDKTYPAQVSSVILSGPGPGVAILMLVQEFKTQRKTKALTRKLKFLFYFYFIVSGQGGRTLCIVRLPCQVLVTGAQTAFEHQCDAITFQPYREEDGGLPGGNEHVRHSRLDWVL